MRIPFFGRKPEPFTEGQIEYLRRYPVLGDAAAHKRWLALVPRPSAAAVPAAPGRIRSAMG